MNFELRIPTIVKKLICSRERFPFLAGSKFQLFNSFGYIILVSITPLITSSSLYDMKKDLKRAERELQLAHSKVLNLRETIARKEIEQIKQGVKQFAGGEAELLDFLDLNRKNLASIMNEVPSCIPEAQIVLDEILITITELKEQQIYNHTT